MLDLDLQQNPEARTCYHERCVGYSMSTLHRKIYPIQHSAGNPKWNMWVCGTELLHACKRHKYMCKSFAPDQRVNWLLLDAMPAHRTFVIGIPAVKTVLTCYMHYVACLKYEQGQKKRPRTPQT